MSYKEELKSNNIDLQSILESVEKLPEKTVLPTLTNPAGAEQIVKGYEGIDEEGKIVTGTLEITSQHTTGTLSPAKSYSITLPKKPIAFYVVGIEPVNNKYYGTVFIDFENNISKFNIYTFSYDLNSSWNEDTKTLYFDNTGIQWFGSSEYNFFKSNVTYHAYY